MRTPASFLRTVMSLAMASASEAHAQLEEVVVHGSERDSRTIEVAEALVLSPDTSRLLKKAPGANVNGNGPLSGIPQYRGMYGPRVGVLLDGVELAPAGPNWMDPPLSYAAAGQLESLELFRGIAPVSVVQESIGGAVQAVTAQADFRDETSWAVDSHVFGSFQTATSGTQLGASVLGASDRQRFRLALLTEEGDDAEFPGGEILPSEYTRQRFDLSYGFKAGSHEFDLNYAYSDTGASGTAALPMDIDFIKGDLASLGYRYTAQNWRLDGRVFASELDHEMTNFHLRQPPAAPQLWRRNTTDSENLGFKLAATVSAGDHSWNFGLDGLASSHNSNIDNPNAAAFFVDNFNNAERRILGAFAELNQQFGNGMRGEFGLRYNRVDSDAGAVDGTPAMISPAAAVLRDTFNAADRSQTDRNIDAVAKLWLDLNRSTTVYAGVGRKTRAPSYQERYLWLPLQATGGLADGFTYTGTIELDSEVAREVEVGVDLAAGRLTLSPRLFYRDIEDYIQGVPSPLAPAQMFVSMMNPGASAPLRFANVDAVLYGFDMDWSYRLGKQLSLRGIVNFVHGERDDTDDNLYRIAPLNATVGLDYVAGHWGASVEAQLVADQDDVSQANGEQPTNGYEQVNLAAWWAVTPELRLAAGVDNLLDETFADHLNGINRVNGNPDLARGERLPGLGINGFLRVDYRF